MPTPSQLDHAKRRAEENPFFVVHEVVECVSEGEEDFGVEDLIPLRTKETVVDQKQASLDAKQRLKHSSTISQTTFDDAVRENIEEFGLCESEALIEAIKDFSIQGVSLDGIDTKRSSTTEK